VALSVWAHGWSPFIVAICIAQCITKLLVRLLQRGQDDARRMRDRAGATHGLSGRLKAELIGSLPPEVEVWAAFGFVLRVGASGLFFYCFLLFCGENCPER